MDLAVSPLLKVRRLLNGAGARYLIIGGQACILHGSDALIASKENDRKQDAADRLRLLDLRRRKLQ